jgi:hypothetical protein
MSACGGKVDMRLSQVEPSLSDSLAGWYDTSMKREDFITMVGRSAPAIPIRAGVQRSAKITLKSTTKGVLK